jgi:hypothetical protein
MKLYFFGLVFIFSPGCLEHGQPAHDLLNTEKHMNLKKQPSEQFTHVITKEAPYYKDGPQQARAQDGIFQIGTKIKILKYAGSYALIESANGIKAYIAISHMKKNI